MRTILCITCLFFFTLSLAAEEPMEGTSHVDFAGYTDCIKLENPGTTVILGPHAGGRVLSYAHKGVEALFQDPAQHGWINGPNQSRVELSAGRFDIGPEHTIPKHPKLWLGPWTAEITGPRRARMTSVEDDATGVQLIRDFELDAASSQLRCTQTIRNASNKTKHWCHWSRTFAQGNGICLIPLTPNSRFPKSYVMYGPGPVINYQPDDPNIRQRDGFLEIFGPPERAKLGMDSHAGWFAYLMRNDLLFIKRFPTYPDRAYNEIAALTISIWYNKDIVCELEPIGPMENIPPGGSAQFTETWSLLPFAFPADGADADLNAIARIAKDN